MTDIVAIETAKAREQAEKFIGWHGLNIAEAITTAILEAKAGILAEFAPDAGALGGMYPHCSHARLLSEEVSKRRAMGL